VNQTATGPDRIAAELAACSFLSARRRAAEFPATRGEERIPARTR